MTEDQLRKRLSDRCKRSSQTETARQLGYSVQYINDVIRRGKGISAGLAKAMGYKKTVKVVITKSFEPL